MRAVEELLGHAWVTAVSLRSGQHEQRDGHGGGTGHLRVLEVPAAADPRGKKSEAAWRLLIFPNPTTRCQPLLAQQHHLLLV